MLILNYIFNDDRWLHSRCDLIYDENECEIASSIGYNCMDCRQPNEPPHHIQGFYLLIFN